MKWLKQILVCVLELQSRGQRTSARDATTSAKHREESSASAEQIEEIRCEK